VKDQLIQKLGAAVAEKIATESQVVYIVAESRKLLEKYPPDPIPFTLKMYLHWALHVDLTNAGTTETFLQRIDKFVESVLAGSVDIIEEHRMFREFAFWNTFRQQLREFFDAYGLPNVLCNEDERWRGFLRLYARVIEDGSLRCQSKTQRLRYVHEVTIKKGKPRPTDNIAPFDLAWHIVLLDGRALTVAVAAADLPDGSPMLIHEIKFHWEGAGSSLHRE
jgi:hypothetical protein